MLLPEKYKQHRSRQNIQHKKKTYRASIIEALLFVSTSRRSSSWGVVLRHKEARKSYLHKGRATDRSNLRSHSCSSKPSTPACWGFRAARRARKQVLCKVLQNNYADCSTTVQLIVRLSTRLGNPFGRSVWCRQPKNNHMRRDYRVSHSSCLLSFGNLWGHSISNPHRTTKENNFLKNENNHHLSVQLFPPKMGTHILQTSFTTRSPCFRVTKRITILTCRTLTLLNHRKYNAPLPTVATHKRTLAGRVPTKPKQNYM